MGFKDTFLKLMFVAIMFLSVLSWVIITQTENNTLNLITNNTLINQSYGDLTSNLGETQSEADKASGVFENITPTSALGFVTVTSIVSPARIFKGLTIGTYNILIALPAQFLGIPEPIVAVLNAILALILILGIWAIWKGVLDR